MPQSDTVETVGYRHIQLYRLRCILTEILLSWTRYRGYDFGFGTSGDGIIPPPCQSGR